jgi:hypothetical protein
MLEKLRLIVTLRQHIRRCQPCADQLQYIAPGLTAVIATRLSGAHPLYITVQRSGRMCSALQKLMLRFSASLATSTTCVSKAVEHS